MTKENNVINYDFKAVNLDTFELELLINIKGELFDKIFSISKNALNKQIGLKVSGSPEDIDEFEGDKRFHGAVKTSTKRVCKKIFKEVARDKIIVTNYYVEKIVFKKDKNTSPPCWIAKIILGGSYVDKR